MSLEFSHTAGVYRPVGAAYALLAMTVANKAVLVAAVVLGGAAIAYFIDAVQTGPTFVRLVKSFAWLVASIGAFWKVFHGKSQESPTSGR
jgi:hypothetical protein